MYKVWRQLVLEQRNGLLRTNGQLQKSPACRCLMFFEVGPPRLHLGKFRLPGGLDWGIVGTVACPGEQSQPDQGPPKLGAAHNVRWEAFGWLLSPLDAVESLKRNGDRERDFGNPEHFTLLV